MSNQSDRTVLVFKTETHEVDHRGSFQSWALDNAEWLSLTTIQQTSDELATYGGLVECGKYTLVDITPSEADVRAWALARRDELGSDEAGFIVSADRNYCAFRKNDPKYVARFVVTIGGAVRSGATLAELAEAARKIIKTPEQKAAELQAAAAKLLAEADALVGRKEAA